ncbi:hypothetical protein [Cupriavidus taiwanensis]|uniref:hypothetical protein n=1 Tax=Cupriavidus taiwanensis TaxID=164546 RepID=UPI0012FF39C8|nr:hypothetical protein [Cupriavidus taiwanensis]
MALPDGQVAGEGRCRLQRSTPVCTIEDVADMEQAIRIMPNHRGMNQIIIQNWQRFEEPIE